MIDPKLSNVTAFLNRHVFPAMIKEYRRYYKAAEERYKRMMEWAAKRIAEKERGQK